MKLSPTLPLAVLMVALSLASVGGQAVAVQMNLAGNTLGGKENGQRGEQEAMSSSSSSPGRRLRKRQTVPGRNHSRKKQSQHEQRHETRSWSGPLHEQSVTSLQATFRRLADLDISSSSHRGASKTSGGIIKSNSIISGAPASRRTRRATNEDEGTADDLYSPILAAEAAIARSPMVRLIARCSKDESMEECLDHIARLREKVPVDVVRALVLAHSVVISVDKQDADQVKSMLEETTSMAVSEDAFRSQMSMPSSKSVSHEQMMRAHRRRQQQRGLVASQKIPYGIQSTSVDSLWDAYGTQGTSNVTVCIIDSGLNIEHEDLDQSLLTGELPFLPGLPWTSDALGHGTHVAGIVTAQDNGVGMVGVAPGVHLHIIRGLTNDGFIYSSDIMAAAEACRDAGAHVINMSLAGPQYSQAEELLMQELRDDGIVLIAAAGNNGRFSSSYAYPASYDAVISVAAVDNIRNRATFSQYNDEVDIAAPGVNVLSLSAKGGYVEKKGTSMASPMVAGIAALLKTIVPTATPDQIYESLTQTATSDGRLRMFGSGTNDKNWYTGHGVVHARAAADYLVEKYGAEAGITIVPLPPNTDDDDTREDPTEIEGCPNLFDLTVVSDSFGYENSFYLFDMVSGEVLFHDHSLEDNFEYHHQVCALPDRCYVFSILDSYGDGIFGAGVALTIGDEVAISSGWIESGGTVVFGEACSKTV